MYFSVKCYHVFEDSLINNEIKITVHLLEVEIFCSIINIFTATFKLTLYTACNLVTHRSNQ